MIPVVARIADALAPSIAHAFGLMGNGNAHFIDALSETSVPYTAVRHEVAAVAAADAFYRASARLALATTTYGAGFTNTITALAESVQAGIPLVLFVGDAPTSGARPWDIDQRMLAASVGARTFSMSETDAGQVAIAAVNFALAHRTPVVLALPYDLTTADSLNDELLPSVELPAPVQPQPEQIAAAADALSAARRPVILAGRGAWLAHAGTPLSQLADRLGALTATTALGRSLFERPEYDLGTVGGFGQEAAMELVGDADVILVAGASLNQFSTRFGTLFSPDATVIRIDDRDPAAHPAVTIPVHGDVALATDGLLAAIRPVQGTTAGWRDQLVTDAARFRIREAGVGLCDDGRLDPRSVAIRLASSLPDNRVTVTDGGHFLGWSNTYWSASSPNRVLMVGTAFQTIGLGFGSAVGAAAALPDATLVVSTGDGGGLMALADLDSVIRTAKRGVIVVWNDAAYGAEIHMYGRMGLGTTPMLIDEADFAGIARSLGGRGDVIRSLDDFADFDKWVESGADGVYLLDCRISASVVAPYQEEIYERAVTVSARS
ncbi:thiamine pyrophosphate-dependent acetolactate synthase large subunit-like protein [Okibacterium sp. HSC-33S16]|uniref:thiamine pyrophosphate-binding protein n=1 Tax=Okibacterium sp. HSC-33S16 TaxID=2910965 RepID=UPI00209C9B6F|nr:thiamine pyrophosphate-binding protein [Okibacterium sp. HSC-33S16]MCP2032246.1 thiamine pyrophosphate-dependent acetolactate synthase large subunit-like protein [Okibacterium sp. HSC-33S16]